VTNLTKKYFGTDGIRGEVGKFPITPDFALRLGYAVGRVLARATDNPAVIIGKDTRISGYLFESSLEAGFSYAGVDVYMAGPVPTPAIAYLTRALNLSAGVVISASHNQYVDNGIKFFAQNGFKLPDSIELEIEQQLAEPMLMSDKLGKAMRLTDAKGRYIEFCKSTFPATMNLRGLKLVLDCAHGATYQVAPNVFKELGATVITTATTPNGMNINHNCGSTHEAHIVHAVKQHGADIGIAFDGDGDRVIFVDNNGIVYNGDKLLYIILQYYLASGHSITGVVGTVMTNLALENALTQQGYNLIRAKVGDRYVLEQMQTHNMLLGGEASGHLLCLDKHTTGDGIIAALQVLAGLKHSRKSLAQMVNWTDYPQKLINVKIANKETLWQQQAQPVIDEAVKNLANDGRVVVRQSGTEALIRVMVEAKTVDLAETWANKIADSINNI